MRSQVRVLILTGVGLEAAHLQVSPAPPSSCLDSCCWSQGSNVSFIYCAIKGPTCGGKPLARWPGKATSQDPVSSCSQRALFGPTPCSISLISKEEPLQHPRTPSPLGILLRKFVPRRPGAPYLGLGKSLLAYLCCNLFLGPGAAGLVCFVLIQG